MLTIKCLKLKISPFKPQKMEKKAGILTMVAKTIELCFVAFWLDFNQNFVPYRMKVILGR